LRLFLSHFACLDNHKNRTTDGKGQYTMMNENKQVKYFDIIAAKKAYLEGKNVTQFLRDQRKIKNNTPEIIEIAYDIQAGTYIEVINNNRKIVEQRASERADILQYYCNEPDSLLDVGTGEMTTLTSIINFMKNVPKKIYAFDISWSRMYKGISYASENMNLYGNRVIPFVADISGIPLRDSSVSVITSNHALEPNGGRLENLMAEIFRVAIDMVILFEPCYEMNSDEGKRRMDELGYIKNVDGVVEKMGGTLFDKIRLNSEGNPLNPTACFAIYPPKKYNIKKSIIEDNVNNFSVPGTDFPLYRIDDFFFSKDTGLSFPIIKSIPVLKSNAGILTSALIPFD
jgi:ubiquinone/menaquinone biosynthesis C-methylase UbiE